MNLGALLPALIFGCIAFVIILYSIKNLLVPFFPAIRKIHFSWNPSVWVEMNLYKKRVKTLYSFDAYLVANQQIDALAALKSSFILHHIKSTKALIERVRIHNIEALDRLLTLSKKNSATIKNIAIIEELLNNRSKLLFSYFDSRAFRDNIKKRKGGDSQNKKEFENQLNSIRNEIFKNKNSLRAELQKAFTELQKPRSSSEITYH